MFCPLGDSDGKYSGKERLKNLTPGTEYEYHVQIRIVDKNNTHVYIPCSGQTGEQIRTAGGCGLAYVVNLSQSSCCIRPVISRRKLVTLNTYMYARTSMLVRYASIENNKAIVSSSMCIICNCFLWAAILLTDCAHA